jgi:hypothetical protein
MSCERPSEPIIDLWRDAHIEFPPNWEGELPPPSTRVEMHHQMALAFQERKLSDEQVKEALDFFEQYEARYYEVTGGEQAGNTYHRPCGGGAVAQGKTGVFCAKCGILPDLVPPTCIR